MQVGFNQFLLFYNLGVATVSKEKLLEMKSRLGLYPGPNIKEARRVATAAALDAIRPAFAYEGHRRRDNDAPRE
jgi:hypothetical protein